MSDAERLGEAVLSHLERKGLRHVRVVAVRRSRSRGADSTIPSSIACLGLRESAAVHRVGPERWVVVLGTESGSRTRCYVCEPCAETALGGRGSA